MSVTYTCSKGGQYNYSHICQQNDYQLWQTNFCKWDWRVKSSKSQHQIMEHSGNVEVYVVNTFDNRQAYNNYNYVNT